MAINYFTDNRLKTLIPVLDDHALWFGRVMTHLSFPGQAVTDDLLTLPSSFGAWLADIPPEYNLDPSRIEDAARTYGALSDISRTLLLAAKPDRETFDLLVHYYNEFMNQMRALERYTLLSDSGIDMLTGLKNRYALDGDIEKEMERRSRRGLPFCLVVAQIDGFSEIKLALDEEERAKIVQDVAALIRKCMRGFDDGYHSAEGEFIMLLKHTDKTSGAMAIKRLRGLLDEMPVLYMIGERPHKLSMSYCTAEPMPGDALPSILNDMRADLTRYETGTLEMRDQSPLQRFLESVDK